MQIIIIGGFLGSGKTTAIRQACALLLKEGRKVAVITNDQGKELVDSKYISSFSIPVKEVANGCFCCNYNDLLQNIYSFSAAMHPDYIFGETVGSCTDITATIVKPLAAMHPAWRVTISVFVDVYLLHSIITGTSSFIDDAVRYIFKKQMEEADVLILNKTDLLSEQQLKEVKRVIQQDHPSKKILLQNSLQHNDISYWLETISKTKPLQRTSLDIDYSLYGAGEAKLGWLDAVLDIRTEKLPSVKAAGLLATIIGKKIKDQELTIGHLKYFINDGKEHYKISYTTAMQDENVLLQGNSRTASVIINARVQADPGLLKHIVLEAIDETSLHANCTIQVQSLSAFRPGFPKPTHRIGN